jgi:HAD superfamily hydrolase (TIGR01450 family)
MTLSPLLRGYDRVLLDLDGCVWVGDEPTPDAVEAVDTLRAAGIAVSFVTNNAMHLAEDFVQRLWSMGFRASLEEVVTAGAAVQHALVDRPQWRRAYVIGAPALHRHVEAAGVKIANGTELETRPDVVVVAAHPGFAFEDLRVATLGVFAGAAILGSDNDANYPTPEGPCPGTGAVLAALTTATGAEALIAGKPRRDIFDAALDRLGGEGRTLMIGDRLDADIGGAQAAGLDAALVLTGATSHAESRALGPDDPTPVAVGATLADLVLAR